MSKRICRICLQTDVDTRDIQETLVDFHDEISEYAINENSALKYCSICEHLLFKFYKFSQKCIKANQILKAFKRNKNEGFPSHLHELLPPTYSLGRSIPSTLQQFKFKNGNLEPLSVQLLVKQKNDTDELEIYLKRNNDSDEEAMDNLLTNNALQENEPVDSYDVKIYNASDSEVSDDQQSNRKNKKILSDKEIKYENKPTENKKTLSLLKFWPTLKETQKSKEQNVNEWEVKLEDYSDDLQENDSNEDSSDSEIINEFKKPIHESITLQDSSESAPIIPRNSRKSIRSGNLGLKRLSKTGKCISIKQQRPKQPLKNHKEYENVFNIQLFATDKEAKEELKLRETSEPYLSAEHRCRICYTVYKYAKQLKLHMRWHDPSAGDHECDVCHMRYENRRGLTSHKQQSHFGKFTCKKCPVITYYLVTMAKHYQYHVGVIYTCEFCDHTFNHPSSYKSHLRTCQKTDQVCVTCARTFATEKGLYAHRNIIHKTKSKVDSDASAHCAPCGLTFANEQVYTVHIMNSETHKDLANSIVACRLCGVRFEDKKDLKEHRCSDNLKYKEKHKLVNMKTSGKDKCTICGMVGTNQSWVCRHIVSAHPDSPYARDLAKRRQHMCDTCGKCYTTKHLLLEHMIVHSGVKPFACASCSARFPTHKRLVIHQEHHEPAKRECPRCGKKFFSAANLSNHMRTHIQDRRYKCSVCDKGFLHAANMREHVRSVHHNVRRKRKGVKRESGAYESS